MCVKVYSFIVICMYNIECVYSLKVLFLSRSIYMIDSICFCKYSNVVDYGGY